VRRSARVALAAALLLVGCASTDGGENAAAIDPLESLNRPIFRANDVLDLYLFNPLATGWDTVTPRAVPHHLEQLFDNLRTPGWALNDLLQGDVQQSAVEWGRFLLNSSVGIGGLFDPAHYFFALEGRVEDFGQTLGVWGVGSGAYLMLPVLGPSAVRELAATPIDLLLDPISWLPGAYPTGVNAFERVNRRSLRREEIANARASALDLYSSLRDGYRQLRESQIANGQAPEEVHDDLYELEEDVPE
jgi:phospholipid-binding lipoprotein MlaA